MEFDKQQLKKVRSAVGMSQSDLADNVNVSRFTVVKWENGKAVPTIAQINRTAAILGVPAKLFIGEGL
jgi:DNA-binding XRE family transcriptional regulator